MILSSLSSLFWRLGRADFAGPVWIFTLPIFSAEDVFEMEYANDPQVSPDGSRVAYVRTSMDIMTDRTRRTIWVVDVDGDNHRPLVSGSGNFSSPQWSPSGDRLAYLSNRDGKTQLFVQWLDGGETAKVTTLPQSPRSIVWSPDGTKIAFTRFVPAKPPTLADMPEKPKGAEWAEPATVVDRMTFRRDGGGYLPTGNQSGVRCAGRRRDAASNDVWGLPHQRIGLVDARR